MANRPPYDRDLPPPGGFDPRYEERPPLRRDPREGGRFEEPYRDGPDPFVRERGASPPPVRTGGMSRSTKLLLGLGGVILLLVVLFALSLGRSGAGSDALGSDSEGKGSEETAAADPEARCAAPATYDRIKRELFRQAALTRGSNQAAYDQLAAYASLRVGSPVLQEQDEGLERVTCSGKLALDLPPGLQVVGGRRTLTADAEYSLQPAADRSGDVVTLRGADGIVVPLATLTRTASAAPQPTPVPGADDAKVGPSPQPVPADGVPALEAPVPPTAPTPPAPVRTSASPSFNCARARTRGEIAVCDSPELASLDRQMAAQYVSALRDSDAEQRARLQSTRDRFLAYRDRCGNDRCIADAYRGRITEIRDILDGRWRGQ